MLAPSSFRRAASWICGWLYVVGNITITLAVNFGTTLFFVACINIFEKEPGAGVFSEEPYQIFLIFLAITLLVNAVSGLANKWLPWIDVSLPYAMATTTTILISLPIDCRYRLDVCWSSCYHCLDSRSRTRRPSQSRMGIYQLQGLIRLDRRLVLLCRAPSCSLCDLIDGYDYFHV